MQIEAGDLTAALSDRKIYTNPRQTKGAEKQIPNPNPSQNPDDIDDEELLDYEPEPDFEPENVQMTKLEGVLEGYVEDSHEAHDSYEAHEEDYDGEHDDLDISRVAMDMDPGRNSRDPYGSMVPSRSVAWRTDLPLPNITYSYEKPLDERIQRSKRMRDIGASSFQQQKQKQQQYKHREDQMTFLANDGSRGGRWKSYKPWRSRGRRGQRGEEGQRMSGGNGQGGDQRSRYVPDFQELPVDSVDVDDKELQERCREALTYNFKQNTAMSLNGNAATLMIRYAPHMQRIADKLGVSLDHIYGAFDIINWAEIMSSHLSEAENVSRMEKCIFSLYSCKESHVSLRSDKASSFLHAKMQTLLKANISMPGTDAVCIERRKQRYISYSAAEMRPEGEAKPSHPEDD